MSEAEQVMIRAALESFHRRYHEAGAPYGSTREGMERWLKEQPPQVWEHYAPLHRAQAQESEGHQEKG